MTGLVKLLSRFKPKKPNVSGNKQSMVSRKDNKLDMKMSKDCVSNYIQDLALSQLGDINIGDVSGINLSSLPSFSGKMSIPDIMKNSAKSQNLYNEQILNVEKAKTESLNAIAQLLSENTEQSANNASAIAASFASASQELQLIREMLAEQINDNFLNSMNYSKHLSDISSSLKPQSDYYSYQTNGTILDVNGNPMRPAEAEAKANIETAWARAQENGFDFIKDFMDPDKESLEQQKLSVSFLESFNPQTLADKLRAKLGVK
jgi:hypothetical protein